MHSHRFTPIDPSEHLIAALTREWFEDDLRGRIEYAMDRQLADLLASDPAPRRPLSLVA